MNAAGVPFWGLLLELAALAIWVGVPVLCIWAIVRARKIKSWFVRWTVRILCAIPIWLALVIYKGCKSFNDTFN